MEQAPAAEQWRPAGFWIRFGADLIDSAVIYTPVSTLIAVFSAVLGGDNALVGLLKVLGGIVAGGVYYTWMTAATGQTLGKKLCGLKVVDQDGGPVSLGQSLRRFCAYGLSYLTLTIGFMMAGWTEEKKALHDYAAGTRVVRSGPRSQEAGGPAVWKIVLAVAAAGVLVLGLAVAGFVWWLDKNKDRLKAEGDAVEARGREFAQGADQAGCVAEARSRLKGAGFMEQVRGRLFLSACLKAAKPTEGFCEGVPPGDSIMATVAYRLEKCADAPEGERDACGRLLDEVQEHCGKASKGAAPEPE